MAKLTNTIDPINTQNPDDSANEPSQLNSTKSAYKSRRNLILMLTVFILPIVLAKLALNNNWLDMGVTNKGQLLAKPLSLTTLGLNSKVPVNKWLIIYLLPNSCDSVCLQSIESVHNSYIAIGKDRPRVAAVLAKDDILNSKENQQLAKSQWQVIPLTQQIKQVLPDSQVLIADPLGNIMLSHEVPATLDQQSTFGKAILADMKKLLKYSKVG